MSSAEVDAPTCLLQKASKASFSALWNSWWLLKHSVTYCGQADSAVSPCQAADHSHMCCRLRRLALQQAAAGRAAPGCHLCDLCKTPSSRTGARLQELIVQIDDVVDVLLLAGAPSLFAGLVCGAQQVRRLGLLHSTKA